MRDPVQSRLGPKPYSQRNRSPPGHNGNYDSGLERDEPIKKNGPPQHDPSITESDADTEVNTPSVVIIPLINYFILIII